MLAAEQRSIPPLNEIVTQYAPFGMEIIPVGVIGTPKALRRMLHLSEDDFGICAYMASSPTKIPGLKEVVRSVAESLSAIDKQYDLKIPLVSGGGNWNSAKPDENTSLMGEWAYGATRNDAFARFVITQGLIEKEGLPYTKGVTVCIKQLPNDSVDLRLGVRTDALMCAGNLPIVFPGGYGTLLEVINEFLNLSINPQANVKKVLVVDPIVKDPLTTSVAPFWEDDIRSFIRKNHAGTISDKTAKCINDHCLVYRPDPSITPQQFCDEIVSLAIAIRAEAPQFNPYAGYTPVRPELLKKHLRPLSGGGTIGRIFDNHPLQDRSWGYNLRYLSTGNQLGLKL